MKRLALFAFLCAAVPARATAERPLKATLTEASGDAQVKESEESDWEPAEPGIQLAAGAQVKTGPDGKADLLFEDGTALHLDKAATLQVAAAEERPAGRYYRFKLWAGRLLSQVAKRESAVDYGVRTPVAAAAVRGTEFVADATEGATDLAVFEGEVETTALDGESVLGNPVSVKPDQELSLQRGRPAGPPRAISRAMGDYRRGAAALFRARMDSNRRDMARVRRLQKSFMERRRRRIDDKMHDFRRRMRRRNQTR